MSSIFDFSVRHRFGEFQLDVSFTTSGGVTGLFGPSGCGKTSILNLIAGLVRPKDGHIRLRDTVFVDTAKGIFLPPQARRVAYVFQEPRLFPHMNVQRNISYARDFGGRSVADGRFDEVVSMLGIGDLLERRPSRLSGGEKQRVQLARALLSDPGLILLDEPMTGLDEARRAEILPWLERLCAETQVPVLYVSHDRQEVAHLAQDIVVLRAGRVVDKVDSDDFSKTNDGL